MESDGRKRDKQKRGAAANIFLAPVHGLNKLTTSILRKKGKEGYGSVTEDDILTMVDAGNESGLFEESSVEMINNVFEFSDLEAGDVMTHRINIVGLDIGASIDDVIYLALDEGFSRIPIYEKTVDKILGIIIVKDLLCLIGNDDYKSFTIKDFLRETAYIPESCSCIDTFKYLTGRKSGIAVVVDEYGGTAGIVTLEDLIEAIMGNIQDEYDEESAEIKKIGKETYEIDGETDPEDVLELFGYELPSDHEYDTIAGFVTDLLGHIPENVDSPEHVDYKDVRFVVKEVEDNRISKIVATAVN
ncbi:MAG: hemolysin family protein [Eubacterium sp.]|jgi:putative hemolysin|nr:hemolysin family protein [Eubacterium sp.]